jgi:hypothetical protein
MARANPNHQEAIGFMMKRCQLFLFLMSAMLPLALNTSGDSITLRDGTHYEGVFVSGSPRYGIAFKDRNGDTHKFAMKNVQSLEFGTPVNTSLQQRPTRTMTGNSTLASAKVIPTGTELEVRTNDTIDSKTAGAGQKFSAVINQDVLDSRGTLAIPKGSDAELVIRSASGGSISAASGLVLDLDSVTLAGRRYTVTTTDVRESGKQGIGANKRTAEMAGGGAALGTLIGAIAGKGKGAAIGAVVGGAAGATGEVLTKGKEVRVPAETLLNFRLERDLVLQPSRYQ